MILMVPSNLQLHLAKYWDILKAVFSTVCQPGAQRVMLAVNMEVDMAVVWSLLVFRLRNILRTKLGEN